jgi:hypothetical protein
VNKEMHNDIIRRLRDAISSKSPKKWRPSSWFLLHDNAPAQRSALVKDFLAKKNVTTMEHTPGSDLAPADFLTVP